MSIVDTTTGEIIDWIDADEARDLTAQAQTEFRSAADHFDRAWSLVEQAVKAGAHLALGYRSPGDYLAAEFNGVLSGLDVASRRIAVRELATYGLSTRAIAPVIGASKDTVHRDLSTGVSGETPPRTPAPEEGEASARDTTSDDDIDMDAETDIVASAELLEDAEPEPCVRPPATVTGIDGKTYPRPTPTAPRRKPLPDSFRDRLYELERKAESLHRLLADDRWAQNQKKVATDWSRNNLLRINDLLEQVANAITTEESTQ